MKKICLNCEFFECCDNEGEFLERGVCTAYAVNLTVDDKHTCQIWEINKQREKDIKDGC